MYTVNAIITDLVRQPYLKVHKSLQNMERGQVI